MRTHTHTLIKFLNISFNQYKFLFLEGLLTSFGMASDQKKKECRQYSVEYPKHGFVQAPQSQQQPMCLLCEKTFSDEAIKPSRVLDHFKKIHPDKKNNSLAYFQSLRDRMQKRKTVTSMFSNSSKQATDGL